LPFDLICHSRYSLALNLDDIQLAVNPKRPGTKEYISLYYQPSMVIICPMIFCTAELNIHISLKDE